MNTYSNSLAQVARSHDLLVKLYFFNINFSAAFFNLSPSCIGFEPRADVISQKDNVTFLKENLCITRKSGPKVSDIESSTVIIKFQNYLNVDSVVNNWLGALLSCLCLKIFILKIFVKCMCSLPVHNW